MPVPIALELPVNMDYRCVQIDVVTAKAERFVLAQAEQRDRQKLIRVHEATVKVPQRGSRRPAN